MAETVKSAPKDFGVDTQHKSGTSFTEKLSPEAMKFFCDVAALPFSQQAVHFLNAYWVEVSKEAEFIYSVAWEKIKYADMHNKGISLVFKYDEGNDLDFDIALYFYEQLCKHCEDPKNGDLKGTYAKSMPEMLTALKRKQELRDKVDVNFDGRVSFLEYLLYQYRDVANPADFCQRSMNNDEHPEIRKARLLLEEVNKRIRAYEEEKARLEAESQLPGVKGLGAKNLLAQLDASPLKEQLNQALITAEAAVRIASKKYGGVVFTPGQAGGAGQASSAGAIWWLERDLAEKKKKYDQKSWTYGNIIDENYNYHIPLLKLQLTELINRSKSKYSRTLVQGPFRSGKTTHLLALADSIKDRFFPIIITFNNVNDIWGQISSKIWLHCNNSPKISNSYDFIQFFSTFNKNTHFSGKPVALLFDEFQIIENSEQKLEFLRTLKDILDSSKNLVCVETMFAFGTSKIITYVTEPLDNKNMCSPFHYDDIIFIKPLPAHEVKQLLKQWASDSKLKFLDNICEDIYNTTGGYAGLVGMVGLSLDNSVNNIIENHNNEIDVNIWLEVRQNAFNKLLHTGMYLQFLCEFQFNTSLQKLVNLIISKQEPFKFQESFFSEALILCSYGILWMRSDSSFVLSCPLIKEFLLIKCYRKISNVNLPSDWSDNIPSLLQAVIPYFNFDAFYSEQQLNITTNFPSKYIFQAEFYTVLRQGIQQLTPIVQGAYCISVEAKTPDMSKNRGDINILVRNGKRILFELKSCKKWSDWDDIYPMIEQTTEYSTFLG
eukprot:gene6265-7805_t